MSKQLTRRNFLLKTGSALAVSSFGFPSVILPKKKSRLGVALVGLGNYSTNWLAPGLLETQHCELRGIVTGTPEKIPVWQESYGIPGQNVYDYENMHTMADNPDIDIVYIVLPNHLHAEYSIIGADAGKHVWCEKPMAMNVEECQSMIDAANKNGVQLTIGYRMQHETNTRKIIRFGREKMYGDITAIESGGGFDGIFSDDTWRRFPEYGGGALFDMGVYPLNASRYSTGLEPVAVSAIQRTDRTEMFPEVDERTDFKLEFPGGIIATCECSFGKNMDYLHIDCTEGWYRLSPFQSFRGVRGETSDGIELSVDPTHHQARQMDNDALAIKENKPPVVPGEDGMADIRIVEGIFKSARLGGEWVEL